MPPNSPSPPSAHAACVAALADLEYELAHGATLDADVDAARRELRDAVAATAPPPPSPAPPWGSLAAPDFAVLAARDPRLAPYVTVDAATGRGRVDFANPAAARALVASLLAAAFSIDWWVPDGALVPPIAGRVEYLDAMARLVEQTRGRDAATLATRPPPLILDVGCGANLIYCLLAAARGWRAIGLDAHEAGLRGAAENLARNPRLAPSITLRASPSPDFDAVGILGHGMCDDDDSPAIIDATVCNPPFFETDAARAATANARSDYGGTPAETVCQGGETAFVGRMVRDSVALRGRCVWFSAMLGRKASLKPLRAQLAALTPPPATVRVVHMRQGRTARWVLAWSWLGEGRKRKERDD